MEILTRTLKRLKVGPAKTFAGLAVYPLIDPEPSGEVAYRTLDEALAAGSVRVTETSASGTVPELRLVNDGDLAVLLLDGEELVGAKQNRVLNLTILAPAGKAIVIPVSCVEAGRWSSVSDRFRASEQVMFSSGRGRKTAQVSASIATSGTRRSDQSRVWRDIEEFDRMNSVGSPTMRMEDTFRARKREIDEFVAAFAAVDGQTGAAFALDGRVRGVELFDHADTMRKLLPKLVRSWALDAISL